MKTAVMKAKITDGATVILSAYPRCNKLEFEDVSINSVQCNNCGFIWFIPYED